jgi:hypothetical protein
MYCRVLLNIVIYCQIFTIHNNTVSNMVLYCLVLSESVIYIRTQNLLLPSIRLSNSAKLFTQLEKKPFQLVYIHQNLKRPPTGRDNGTPARSYKFCTCQFTFKALVQWSLCDCPMRKIHCDKADFTKNCGTAYKTYALS